MLTGTNVKLSPLETRHAESSRQWANDPELMRLLDRSRPVSDHEHEQWFASLNERKESELHFAIETTPDSRHIGNIWLRNIHARHRKAEISVLIGRSDSLSKGMGSEAISLLSRYASETLSLHRLYAHVLAFNERARKAFEKAGFELEGTLRSDRLSSEDYVDVHILGKLA